MSRTIEARDAPPAGPLQIVFRGECLDGFDPKAVRQALAEALELDEQRTARLFSGRRVVLRRAVTPAAAEELTQRFARLGALVHVEERPSRRVHAPGLPESGLRLAGMLGLGLGGVVLIALVLGPGLHLLAGDDASVAAPPRVPTLPAPAATTVSAAPEPAATRPTPASATAPARPGAAVPALPDAVVSEMPADMTPEARSDFERRYASAPGHKAFAIADGGGHGWQVSAGSEDEARERALELCRRAARTPGAPCRVVNSDDVWEE